MKLRNTYLFNKLKLKKLSLKHLDDIHEYSIKETFFNHTRQQLKDVKME